MYEELKIDFPCQGKSDISAFEKSMCRINKGEFSREQLLIVQQIYTSVGTELSNRRTIKELAETYCISMTTLKRCFKKMYGVTIYQYLKRCRMVAAAKDLRESNDTVLDIANRWGYENGSKFSMAFKQVIGCNPREYRLQRKFNQV